MIKRMPVLLVLCVLLLSGCVQSLNPFFTDDAKVAMPELNGRWTMLGDNGQPKAQKDWVFEDGRIMTYSEKGGAGILVATWFKVGGQLFVDTTADSVEPGVISDWWVFHVMPVHILCKVEQNGGKLTFRPLSLDWTKNAATNGLTALPFVRGRDGDMTLFSAEPQQWMDFLKQQATNDEAFAGDNACTFERSQERVRIQVQ